MIGMKWLASASLLMALSPLAQANDAHTPEDAANRYLAAEAQFDQQALQRLLATDFVEISPAGEVDERDRVLSFYTADKKVAAPTMQVEPFKARQHGDSAVLTTHISFQMQEQQRVLTAGIVAKRSGAGWQLLSAQYTAIRPRPAQ